MSTIDRSKQSQMYCPSVVDLDAIPNQKSAQKKNKRAASKTRLSPHRFTNLNPSSRLSNNPKDSNVTKTGVASP